MIDLVIIYNHKYESNIPKLNGFYKSRFRKIWHLMPFYMGNDESVIPVYDGSFTFQSFIAQAAARLKTSPADHFLFLSDDLLLDPSINQKNMLEAFGMDADSALISGFEDLSKGQYGRGVSEGRKTTLQHPGLEIAGELPPFDEAVRLLGRHVKLDSLTLRKYRPYKRDFLKPATNHAWANWKIFKGNIWHLREKTIHWFRPKTLEYPLIGGYSDIFCVPSTAFDEFAHYCGVFAAARVFVELAIPTSLALSCSKITTEERISKKGLNVWFPPGTWAEMEKKSAALETIQRDTGNSLRQLVAKWPSNYLYLHPVKLSKWSS